MINCRARSYGADVVRRGQPGSPASGGASPYLRRGILRQPARYFNAYGVNPGLRFPGHFGALHFGHSENYLARPRRKARRLTYQRWPIRRKYGVPPYPPD